MIAGPVSFLYAGILGLVLIAQAAVRAHASFDAHVPFGVILLVLAEIAGLPTAAVHAAGLLLVASCVLQAWKTSASAGPNLGAYGSAGSRLAIAGLSLWLLYSTTAAFRFPEPG